MKKLHNSKPTIVIYASNDIQDTLAFQQVLWGIEEEGIPYLIKNCEREKSIPLSYQAALHACLEVGIGFGEDGMVVLHYSKLNQANPVFVLCLTESHDRLRALGSNAARLVKGTPFKSA